MTETFVVDFGEVKTAADGSVRRVDVARVDGADLGIRFVGHVSKRGSVTSYWCVEGDPDSRMMGNRVFALERAYELSML